MAKELNHYDRLGVARNAPDEVIRGAYKALAQKNHPDKNLGNPDSTNIMQAINLAYDVLSDAGKRADYDARLNQQERQPVEEKAQRSPAYTAYTGGAVQPYPTRSRGGLIFLLFVLLAAIFGALFVYASLNPASVSALLPGRGTATIAVVPAQRPVTAETFVSRETTPHELAVCIFAAAKTYAVPPALLLSLLSVEGGVVGEKTPAVGHTYDLGLMQINSSWIPELAKIWEVSPEAALRRVRDDACTNIGLGAWILQTALDRGGDIAAYRASAHHTGPKADDGKYVEKVMKLMELYKPIHSPEDLLGQTTAPPAK